MREIRIGTRGSSLAKWQARYVRDALLNVEPGLKVVLDVIRTTGDRDRDSSLPTLGTGVFTKEIEYALLEDRVDLAVHSLKDLPTELPEGLTLAAVPVREDPADALVAEPEMTLKGLPEEAEVLTGSMRRRAQVLHARPDVHVVGVRGNVQTRLRKFREGNADALVLARAGLLRLGLQEHVAQRLEPDEFVCAPGQGALGVEARSSDGEVLTLCAAINRAELQVATAAERVLLAALGGGCQVPIGAYARFEGRPERLVLTAVVADPDGRRLLRRQMSTRHDDLAAAGELAGQMARALRQDGCQEILDEVLRGQGPPAGGAG